MKKRFLVSAALCAALVFVFAAAGCSNPTSSDKPKIDPNVYVTGPFYVSMSDGSDSNDGLSTEAPFKTLAKVNSLNLGPDAHVSFKCGDIWVCYDEGTALVPKGRGDVGHPIIIDSYGSGNRPIIAGSGLQEAIRIQKIEYIRVQDLEITNDDSKPYMSNPAMVAGPQVRRGVYVMANNIDYNPYGSYTRRDQYGRSTTAYGAMNGIELVNLDIHDVYGYSMHANDNNFGGGGGGLTNAVGMWWLCGGIIFLNGDLPGNGGGIGRANLGLPVGHLVNPLIQDCYIHDVMCTAIYADHSPGTWDVTKNDDSLDYTFTGLKVTGTVIQRTGSEGIAVTNAFWNFTIDHCGVYDLAYLAKNWGWYMGYIYIGDNSVTQNCELARMLWTGDSHCFDNDIGCWGLSLVQYNYCRDATGTFLMDWGGSGAGEASTIVRYNVSVNNGSWPTDTYQMPTLLLNTNSNIYFYNNVFYNDKGKPIRIESSGKDNAAFVNNVFWTKAPTVLDLSGWKSTQADANSPAYFYNNAYYNPAGVVTNSAMDYPSRLGISFGDDNMIKLNQDPFGTIVAGPPGGAGDNEDRTGPGYNTIISGAPARDITALAGYFKIDSSSPLYQAGHPVTKTEVDNFIWGKSASTIPVTPPHLSTVQRGDPNTFNKNGGIDFFGNPIPDPTSSSSPQPSVGIDNP